MVCPLARVEQQAVTLMWDQERRVAGQTLDESVDRVRPIQPRVTFVTRNSKSANQLTQNTQAVILIWGPGVTLR